MDYLDFAIEVHAQTNGVYVIAVRSLAGEARTTVPFPFTDAALESHLLKLENAILRSAGRRRKAPTPEEEAVQGFGRDLFGFLLRDELLSRFRACQQLAHDQQKGVRIKLTVTPPELAVLPWEFLYDPARRDYLCLDATTPLVRYPEVPLTIQPLPVTAPLRILGLCVDAADLTRLEVAEEQQRMAQAVEDLRAQGRVELTWLPGQSADDLQRAMRRGPWHILHFIGHGSFDQVREEGTLLLSDATGKVAPLYATQLARLLAPQRHFLRLVLLNACEGARGGRLDLFSSTAATLVGSGIPAVLAMQYEITDAAAIDFARTFYEALADNLPVDAAVADARNAMTLHNHYSLEWGTPVLYLRAPDGRLFDVAVTATPAAPVEANIPVTRTAPIARAEPVEAPITFDWVTIPAGQFRMGSDKAKDKLAYDAELPQHEVTLAAYRMARYPVTVAQFEQFVKATGYQTTAEKQGSAWGWTGTEYEEIKGAYWAHPRGPDSDVKQKADHPVTCISWHDANEFCRWATSVLRSVGQTTEIRLPTEAEWEKAARGTDVWIYPWGNEAPDKTRCNFHNDVGDTTPVGSYPKGKSFYGVLDMVGNVREWTSSLWGQNLRKPDFSYPYDPNDGREDPAATSYRVVRSGLFWYDMGFMRCAAHSGEYTAIRKDDTGFRVVCPGS